MICAIGVRPEACAIAYSLALRSLLKTGELGRGDRLQPLFRSERDSPALDPLEIDRRRLTLLVAERYRPFPEQSQSKPWLHTR